MRSLDVGRSGERSSLRPSRSRPAGGGEPSGHGAGPAGIETWSPVAVHAVVLVLAIAMAVLDDTTGPGVDSGIFYVVPVLLAAWRLGTGAGLLWAVTATAISFAVSVGDGPAGFTTEPWNALALLVLLLLVAILTGIHRRLWLERRVLVRTDGTTGALNRRAFHDRVEQERARSVRYDRPFTVAYLDIDGLGAVNQLGDRPAGDLLLQQVAETLRANSRGMDAVGRLGGDEFGVLFPETGPGAAEAALERLRRRVDEVVVAASPERTVSMGAVICVGAPESVRQLMGRAAALVREVKARGGGGLRVEVLDDIYGIEAILRRG